MFFNGSEKQSCQEMCFLPLRRQNSSTEPRKKKKVYKCFQLRMAYDLVTTPRNT